MVATVSVDGVLVGGFYMLFYMYKTAMNIMLATIRNLYNVGRTAAIARSGVVNIQ